MGHLVVVLVFGTSAAWGATVAVRSTRAALAPAPVERPQPSRRRADPPTGPSVRPPT